MLKFWCISIYLSSPGFLSTLTIVLDILIEPERSYRTRTNSTRIVWVADVGTVGLVVCTAAFTGLMRMKWLTVYLLKLQEVGSLLVYLYYLTSTTTLVGYLCTAAFSGLMRMKWLTVYWLT